MGRFRSLFDADEMRDLAVAAGIVDEAVATPETAEPVVRGSLLLDDDAQEVPEQSPSSSSPTAAPLDVGGPPAQAYSGSTDERVRRLLMHYLTGESAAAAAEPNDRSEIVDTPLPAIVMDDDEVPLDAPPQALWHETSSLGSDESTRAFLATPSAALSAASDHMDTSAVAVSDGPFADSPHVRSELPWGAAAGGVDGGVENASDAQAPELASESGSTVWDTPFEDGHSRTVVSEVTDPAPLPGQQLLTKLSRPPLFTLLRASLIARVPWRVWQREPWAQPNLCAALAEVTGESEQLFEQEDAWRN